MPEVLHTITAFLAAKAFAAAILAAFVTAIAYVHNPRAKTLVFCLPIPFTCAYIQSGLHINNTHVFGLFFVTFYHWVVYVIVRRLKLPLWAGILVAVVGYVLAMSFSASSPILAPLRAPAWFGALVVLYLVAWAIGAMLYHPIVEPGHRSYTPWYVKSPLIFVIALCIFSLTNLLGGGVTTFPYAGVFLSYEMRHSLRTLAGQYMVNNITMFLMFLAIWWLEQHGVDLVWRLLAGWAVLALGLAVIYHVGMGKPQEPILAGD